MQSHIAGYTIGIEFLELVKTSFLEPQGKDNVATFSHLDILVAFTYSTKCECKSQGDPAIRLSICMPARQQSINTCAQVQQ